MAYSMDGRSYTLKSCCLAINDDGHPSHACKVFPVVHIRSRSRNYRISHV